MTPCLFANYWTLAGGASPMHSSHISPFGFDARLRAASNAGFNGIGCLHSDLARIAQIYRLPNVRTMLADAGMKCVEVEFLTDWLDPQTQGIARSEALRFLLEAGAVLGASHIKIGDLRGGAFDMQSLVDAFASVCEAASEYELNVSCEIMPWSRIHSLAIGGEMVSKAGAPNGGLTLDLWHLARTGVAPEALQVLPPTQIFSVELSDGIHGGSGDLKRETTEQRRPCGEGEFTLRDYIRELERMNYRGAWGVEIMSSHFRQLSLADMACVAYDSAVTMFG